MSLLASETRPVEWYSSSLAKMYRVIGIAKTDANSNVVAWEQKQLGNIVASGSGGGVGDGFFIYNYWYTAAGSFHSESFTEPAGLLADGAFWLTIIDTPNGDDPAVPSNNNDIVLLHYQKCIPIGSGS